MTDSTIEAPATPRLKQQYKDVIESMYREGE